MIGKWISHSDAWEVNVVILVIVKLVGKSGDLEVSGSFW